MINTEITNFPIQSSIAPWLSVRDSVRAADFYKSAFGAIESYRLENPDGGLVAKLSVDGAKFWLSEGSPDSGNSSPEPAKGGSVRMTLTVTDQDVLFA